MKPVFKKYENKKITYLGKEINCCCEVFEAWVGELLVYEIIPIAGEKTWGIKDYRTKEMVIGSFHHCPYCGIELPDMEEPSKITE